MLALLVGWVLAGAPQTGGAAEVERIAALGGSVERDAQGRVTGVGLQGAWVGDGDLEALARIPTLARLDLSLTRVSDAGLLALRGLRGVRELDLRYAEQVTDEGVAAIRDWPRLERLVLRGTRITDTTLALLASKSSLVALDVSFAQITDSGLRHLAGLGALRELSFGGNKLTEQALEVLRTLPALERLDLSGRQRTDSGLWSVSLTDLALDPVAQLAQLRELELGGAQITARGLEKLGRLARLERLDLHGARRVGDDAVGVLEKLPALRWVDLAGTSVSRDALQRLRQQRPQLTALTE